MTVDMIIQSTEALEEAVIQYSDLLVRKEESIKNKNEEALFQIEKQISELKNYILSLIIHLDKLVHLEKNAKPQ